MLSAIQCSFVLNKKHTMSLFASLRGVHMGIIGHMPRSTNPLVLAILIKALLILDFAEYVGAQEAQIVRDFQRSGKSPQSAVIEASDGFLYGTTQQGGGISEGGTVYKIAKDGSG